MQQDNVPVSFEIAKARILKRKWTPQLSRARATYQERRSPKSEVEKTWPRQVRTIFARLRTGHSKELPQYRYMIEKDDEPTCQEYDDDEETIEHILCHCPAWRGCDG